MLKELQAQFDSFQKETQTHIKTMEDERQNLSNMYSKLQLDSVRQQE